MKLFEFKPKLVSCLKNYSKETFMADLMAGVIVGIVALLQAVNRTNSGLDGDCLSYAATYSTLPQSSIRL